MDTINIEFTKDEIDILIRVLNKFAEADNDPDGENRYAELAARLSIMAED